MSQWILKMPTGRLNNWLVDDDDHHHSQPVSRFSGKSGEMRITGLFRYPMWFYCRPAWWRRWPNTIHSPTPFHDDNKQTITFRGTCLLKRGGGASLAASSKIHLPTASRNRVTMSTRLFPVILFFLFFLSYIPCVLWIGDVIKLSRLLGRRRPSAGGSEWCCGNSPCWILFFFSFRML